MDRADALEKRASNQSLLLATLIESDEEFRQSLSVEVREEGHDSWRAGSFEKVGATPASSLAAARSTARSKHSLNTLGLIASPISSLYSSIQQLLVMRWFSVAVLVLDVMVASSFARFDEK